MHDGEEKAGVGKLFVFFLRLVPRRGGRVTGTADGEQVDANNEEQEIAM